MNDGKVFVAIRPIGVCLSISNVCRKIYSFAITKNVIEIKFNLLIALQHSSVYLSIYYHYTFYLYFSLHFLLIYQTACVIIFYAMCITNYVSFWSDLCYSWMYTCQWEMEVIVFELREKYCLPKEYIGNNKWKQIHIVVYELLLLLNVLCIRPFQKIFLDLRTIKRI